MRQVSIILGSLVALSLAAIVAWAMFRDYPARTPLYQDNLEVSATIYPLVYLAERIGAEYADVSMIIPMGVEPHDYEPTPQDIIGAQQSGLVIANGGGVDDWITDVDAQRLKMMVDEVAAQAGDPHIWLDPVLMQDAARIIRDEMIAADSEHADAYSTNAERLIIDLAQLDQAFRDGLATCETREIVVSHDAFGYLAERYNFIAHAIAGISPEEEPSLAALADLADLMRERGLKTVFFEELVSDDLARTLADEVGAEVAVLSPLEGLTKEHVQAGEDYYSIMLKNLEALRSAMVCR